MQSVKSVKIRSTKAALAASVISEISEVSENPPFSLSIPKTNLRLSSQKAHRGKEENH